MYTGEEALSHLPLAKHLYIETLRNPSSYIKKVHNSFTNNNTNEQNKKNKKKLKEKSFLNVHLSVIYTSKFSLTSFPWQCEWKNKTIFSMTSALVQNLAC